MKTQKIGPVLKGAVILICSLILFGCFKKDASVHKKSTPAINVWHWMTDREAAFLELAKRYEEQSGIKVNFELYAPSEAYSQKVRAAAQGDNLPDIFSVLGEKRDFSAFVNAGYISDLSGYMDENSGEWKNRFFPEALAVNEFIDANTYGVRPGIYGVPIDITTIMMLYNKADFRALGLDPQNPPRRWEEFIEAGRRIKQSNKHGLVSGWGEIWMIDCLASNFAFNIMGKDKVLATLKGDVPYTDPDWIRVFSLFKEMQDSGLLYNGLVSMVNKTAEQLFANGRAVFSFNGSWGVNVYKGMNPGLEYGVMLPPVISDEFPQSVWGGAGSSFMVSAKSANKEEAVKFLKWLTDKQQQVYLAQETNNLPANKDAVGVLPDVLAEFSRAIEYATHPRVWGVTEFSRVIEAFDKGIQSIIIGENTPEGIAREVQNIKDRELAKTLKAK